MSEWRKIEGVDGYEFSFEGKDAKCWSHLSGKYLSVKPSSQKRIMWSLRVKGSYISYQAGRWIALAFPELVQNEYFEGAEIDHIDTDPMNNNPSNLRWVTRIGNQNNELTRKHMSLSRTGVRIPEYVRNKISVRNKGHVGYNKKPVAQYTKENVLIKEYSSLTETERETGVPTTNIASVCLNKPRHKTAGGYKWAYIEQ